MNIVISVSYTGTPDADDVLAAYQIVGQENKDRAALTPPGTQLSTDTAANLKASYLSLLKEEITRFHQRAILFAKSNEAVATRFTPAEVEQIRINLITQLNSGATTAAVIAKTV
jgi:hypothetical protein